MARRSRGIPVAGDRPRGAERARIRALAVVLVVLAATVACRGSSSPVDGETSARKPDVPYEPTPPEVVRAMMDLAEVGPDDVVYDLGCGDGRIVVEAARRGARGVGVDLDPLRIREARANSRAAGVEHRVEFRVEDLFETDVSPASVVMLYLWPHVNLKLQPKLVRELLPGARVVSHAHDMGSWRPDRTVRVGGAWIHLWTIPDRPVRPVRPR
jgi:SAM-dependent methyltransferase